MPHSTLRSRQFANGIGKLKTETYDHLPLTHKLEQGTNNDWTDRRKNGKLLYPVFHYTQCFFKWMHRNNLQWFLFFCMLLVHPDMPSSSSSLLKVKREKKGSETLFLNVGGYAFSAPQKIGHRQNVVSSRGLQEMRRISVLPIKPSQVQEKPRNIGLHLQEKSNELSNRKDKKERKPDMLVVGTERLSSPMNHSIMSTRKVYVSPYELMKREILLSSEDYDLEDNNHSSPECDYIHDWQHTSHLTCNTLHETFLGNLNPNSHNGGDNMVQIVSTGGYQRDVWLTKEYNGAEKYVVKTVKGEKIDELSKIEAQQVDAIVMEKLTSSPYVMNIYGFCGTSAIHEISKEPHLYDQLFYNERRRDFNMTYKVQIAQQVAAAVADMHFTDGDDHLPTFSHADVMADQFLFVDNGRRVKLNDFNRGAMLKWNKMTGKLCGYTYSFNGGRNRSPEEYLYHPQTDKVDVYSMGNIIYSLLTEEKPFYDVESSDLAIEMVKKGGRPNLNHPVIVSQKDTNPLVQFLLEAMDMCWTFNPEKRPNSRQVHAFLTQKMNELEVPIL